MYGALLFGEQIYAGVQGQVSSFVLNETITLSENTIHPSVALTVYDFVFTSESLNTNPDRALSDTLRINDWVEIKRNPADSPFSN